MDTKLPKAPNARDYALAAWDRASMESRARFLIRRDLDILGKDDPESMRKAFERYLDAELCSDL